MMKKAKQVTIPDDRNLTQEEFNELQTHAMNSSMWYTTNYARNSQQVKEKLYKKGYIEDDVSVNSLNGEVKTFNIVDETVERLIDLHMINDQLYARNVVKGRLSQGSGMNKIRMDLTLKKVDPELIDEVMAEVDDEQENDALEKAFNRALTSYSYRNESDPRKKKQKFVNSLVSKGFQYSEISDMIDEKLEDE